MTTDAALRLVAAPRARPRADPRARDAARTSRWRRACCRAAVASRCSRSTASRGWSTRSATRRAAIALALLDALEADLAPRLRGAARHPLLRRLTPVLGAHGLPREPFVRLIEANRCRSAAAQAVADLGRAAAPTARSPRNPVGELVLHVFGAATPERVALSDRVCSALQVIEHCQDVGRGPRARTRLSARARTSPRATAATRTSRARARLRAAPRARRCELARARALLGAGAPLVAQLRGFARSAVAGYVAGGLAAAEALERAGFDAELARARGRAARRCATACASPARERAR